ncbi:uncharacterized protein LOC144444186 [Glandiceps talaboti]
MLETAGSIIVNFTRQNLTSYPDCALRFSVAKGNRVSLTFVSNLFFPLDSESPTDSGTDTSDCSNGYLKVFDPVANRYLTTESPLCGVHITSKWTSYFTEDAYFVLEIVTNKDNFNGSLNFIVNYTSFENVTKGDANGNCYNCIQLDNSLQTPVCIQRDLLCDGIINCPRGYASDEDFTFTYDPVCRFRCDFQTSTFIDRSKVCDGNLDCPNGKDEDPPICDSQQIVGCLSQTCNEYLISYLKRPVDGLTFDSVDQRGFVACQVVDPLTFVDNMDDID